MEDHSTKEYINFSNSMCERPSAKIDNKVRSKGVLRCEGPYSVELSINRRKKMSLKLLLTIPFVMSTTDNGEATQKFSNNYQQLLNTTNQANDTLSIISSNSSFGSAGWYQRANQKRDTLERELGLLVNSSWVEENISQIESLSSVADNTTITRDDINGLAQLFRSVDADELDALLRNKSTVDGVMPSVINSFQKVKECWNNYSQTTTREGETHIPVAEVRTADQDQLPTTAEATVQTELGGEQIQEILNRLKENSNQK